MSTLYIVATPIGNLEDITMRALRILNEVDFILCEDTRVTQKLLGHYGIKTATISYHQHSDLHKIEYILELLEKGKNLALVSDAGTPGISDPGGKLVQAVLERFPLDAEDQENGREIAQVQIESVPGASAVTAALSISGIPTDKFIFMGFPPHKKGRQTFLRKIAESEYPAVVYESKHRIIKFLEELKNIKPGLKTDKQEEGDDEIANSKFSARDVCASPRLGSLGLRSAYGGQFPISNIIPNPKSKKEIKRIDFTSVVVCREISKMHETVYRGDIKHIVEQIKKSANDQKGEFVVIIGK